MTIQQSASPHSAGECESAGRIAIRRDRRDDRFRGAMTYFGACHSLSRKTFSRSSPQGGLERNVICDVLPIL
jgi:hypothetical protein